MKAVHVLKLGALALPLVAGCGDNQKGACDPDLPGSICTIAGNGQSGYSGDEGPALSARLSLPMDTLAANDGSGMIYIVDWNNHRIRSWTPNDGKIHFVAGNGEIGGSLDDPATGNFNHPTQIIYDKTGGQLYLAAWHNSKVRRLDLATGDIVDSCGDGRRAYFGDGASALTASLDLPASIAWAPDGSLTILDQANQVIRSIDGSGNIHKIAGNCVIDAPAPSGPGACAAGVAPTVCPAPSGKTTCGDAATWCSKACTPGYAGDEGPASGMRMGQAFGQAADPGGKIIYDKAGNLYFADSSNNVIREIDTNGMVHRIAGQAPISGMQMAGYAGDEGPAASAMLNHPVDLALSDDGTMYFSDVFNHCIRSITPDKVIHTVAGQCGTKGFSGDGKAPTEALLNRPYGVEWAAPNKLYVADTGNSVIRVVNLP